MMNDEQGNGYQYTYIASNKMEATMHPIEIIPDKVQKQREEATVTVRGRTDNRRQKKEPKNPELPLCDR